MRLLTVLLATILYTNVKSQIILPTDQGNYVSFQSEFFTPMTVYEACDLLDIAEEVVCIPTAVKTAFIVKVEFPVESHIVEYYGVINVTRSKLYYVFNDYRVDKVPIEEWEKTATDTENVESQIFCHTVFMIARLRGNIEAVISSSAKFIQNARD